MLCTCLALAVLGCARAPLLERAIRARGGPLTGVVRDSDFDVRAVFPGRWHIRSAFLQPDRWGWTIFTSGEPDHYLFDGRIARTFIGGRTVAADAGTDAPLRSHARFMAVAHLDVLRAPGIVLAALGPGDLPAGAAHGLAVVLDGSRYRLAFDARDRLVWLTGPIDLPPLGASVLSARYDDFRRVGRFILPFRVEYALAGQALADETIVAACPDPPGLTPVSFATPPLPACAGPAADASSAR
jgi:hypothetical protein